MIPVLMYHHINYHTDDTVTVTPDVFAGQMNFLAEEGYQTLLVDELLEFISGKKSFRQKAVVITFDDGWLDNFLYAVPVLSTHNFNASFFIITARADDAAKVSSSEVDIPDHETSKKLIQSGQTADVALDWEKMKGLQDSSSFRFYSHTVNHKRCADLSRDAVALELSQSKERMEIELGKSCDYLCWPYGSFSEEAVSIAAKIGYKGFFTTVDGFCEPGSDPYMIKRIEVKNSVQWLKGRLSEGSL